MNRGVRYPGQIARVSEPNPVCCPIVRFRPGDLTVMAICLQKRLHALRRVIFHRQGRRAPPDASPNIVCEETPLERVTALFHFAQLSPNRLRQTLVR